MAQDIKTEITSALRELQSVTHDDALFDELSTLRKANSAWDGAGTPPNAERLAELGIAVQRSYSTADAQAILAGLKKRIMSAMDSDDPELDSMLEARKALQTWSAGGCPPPLPFEAELAGWGVWPPGSLAADASSPIAAAEPAKGAPPVIEAPEVQKLAVEDSSSAPVEEPTVSGRMRGPGRMKPLPPLEVATDEQAPVQEVPSPVPAEEPPAAEIRMARSKKRMEPPPVTPEEPPKAAITSPAPPAEETSVVTLPSEAQTTLEQARGLIAEKQYFQASALLAKLIEDTPAELPEGAAALKLEADDRLAEVTRERIQEAEKIAREHPADLDRQRRAWERVLQINPEAEIAQAALNEIVRRVVEAEVKPRLERILKDAEWASRESYVDLPEINRQLVLVDELVERGKKGELSYTLFTQARQTQEQIIELRRKARERLGIASSTQGNDLRIAYLQAKEYVDNNLPVAMDTANLLGGGAYAEVNPVELFSVIATRYIEYLKTFTLQRLAQASAEAVTNPEQALTTLEEVGKRLTDEQLYQDHRRQLQEYYQQVVRQEEKIKPTLNAYNKAKKLVGEAQTPGMKASDSLAKINYARQEFPNYPGLDELETAARRRYQIEAADEMMGNNELGADTSAEISAASVAVVALEQARGLIAEKQYFQASVLLARLLEETPEEAPEGTAALKLEADSDLARLTRERIQEAEKIAREHPADLDRQRRAWERVLQINPEAEIAQAALNEIVRRVVEAEVKPKLERILKDAEWAGREKFEDLPEINKQLGLADELVERGKKGELSYTLFTQARQTQEQIKELRRKARERLGVASSIEGEDLLKAYLQAKEYVDNNLPVALDTANLLGGGADAEVPPGVLFNKISEHYISYLRKYSTQRLAQAAAEAASNPELALNTLKEVGQKLTNDQLSLDHRKALQEDYQGVVKQVDAVNATLAAFNRAKILVVAAQAPGTKAADSLDNINKARQEFPNYPGLNELETAARSRFEIEVATELKGKMVSAEGLSSQKKFSEAINLLNQAREAATEKVSDPKVGSSLAIELEHLEKTITSISAAEAAYQRMNEILAQAQTAIAEYDQEKDSQKLKAARTQLDQLTDDQRKDPAAIKVQSDLASRLGDAENWEVGTQQYVSGNWSGALEFYTKIKPGFIPPDGSDVEQRKKRTMAAQAGVLGKTHTSERKWSDALEQYRKANDLFYGLENQPDSGVGYDEYTRSVAELSQAECIRLKPIEENDRKVRQVIEQARNHLNAAKADLEKRSDLGHKLQEVSALISVVNELKPLKDIESNLAGEVSDLQAQARIAWHDAFLAKLGGQGESVLEQVLASDDLKTLEMAKSRAEELEEANLLSSSDDRDLQRRVLLHHLDIKYRDDVQAGPQKKASDAEQQAERERYWQELEANRRQALRYLSLLRPSSANPIEKIEAQRTSVQKELLGMVRERIEAVIQSKKTFQEAQAYLQERIDSTDARRDAQLNQRLIDLYWETSDWEAARQAARKCKDLLADGAAFTALWVGLTDITECYAQGDVDQAEARQTELENQSESSDALQAIKDEVKQIRQKALEKFLNEGSQAMKGGANENYILAAEKLSKAYRISPENARVAAQLRALSGSLAPGIKLLHTQAASLRIAHRPLPDVLKTANGIYDTLAAMVSVSELLELESNDQATLTEAYSLISDKRNRWSLFQAQVEVLDQAINDALANPELLSRDFTSGGWNFDGAVEARESAVKLAGKDRELLPLLDASKKRLDDYQETAERLLELVGPLMQAIKNEDFSKVLEVGDTLDHLWNEIRATEIAWAGLDRLVRYNYPTPDGEVNQVRKHMRVTEAKAANLRLWDEWAKRTSDASKTLSRLEIELLSRPLDDIVQRKSLKEIIAGCDSGIKSCNVLLDAVNAQPKELPRSAKAEVLANSLDVENLRDKVQGKSTPDEGELQQQAASNPSPSLKSKFTILKDDAARRLAKLTAMNGPLPKLKRAVENVRNLERRGPVASRALDGPRKILQECEAIDPMNDELFSLRSYLDSLATI